MAVSTPATYVSIYADQSGKPNWGEVFDIYATPVFATSTQIVIINTDGSKTVLAGTGFTYDADGIPTGGGVTSIGYLSDTNVLYAEWEPEAAWSLTGIYQALEQAQQADDDDIFFAYLFQENDVFMVEADGDQYPVMVYGYAGDDFMNGGPGQDIIVGGIGDDFISGGAGNDTIDGGFDIDTISGGAGDDFIYGGADNWRDYLWGEAGNDTIYGGGGRDQIGGGTGDDVIFGEAADDVIWGGAGLDIIRGGTGNDRIDGGFDIDVISGGAGDDIIRGGADNWRDYLWGEAGNDTIYGGGGRDQIGGGTGDDILLGQAADDVIWGGAGDDELYGGYGNDRLMGGAGNDLYWTGPGQDLVIYGKGDGTDRIKDFQDDVDFIDFGGWGFANVSAALTYATQQGAHVQFDFTGISGASSYDVLWVENITISALSDDIIV